MKNFNFWDVDADCPIEENFEGTIKQARKRAITLAKKWNTIVCIEDGTTYDDIATFDANGNEVYF